MHRWAVAARCPPVVWLLRGLAGLIRRPLWCLLCCLLVWRGLLALRVVHSLVLPARGAA